MKKTIPKLLTLVCLLVAIMGLSIVTAHAATVTGTISGGNEYRYHEDKTPVPQWGAFTSTKLKYFTRDDTGVSHRKPTHTLRRAAVHSRPSAKP